MMMLSVPLDADFYCVIAHDNLVAVAEPTSRITSKIARIFNVSA